MNMKNNFIGKRIAQLRLAKGVSARTLSLDLEQSYNYINQIENGKAYPSIDGLYSICDYFQISVSDFFDEKTEYPLQYRKIIEELNKLDSIELEKVFDMIKMITANKK